MGGQVGVFGFCEGWGRGGWVRVLLADWRFGAGAEGVRVVAGLGVDGRLRSEESVGTRCGDDVELLMLEVLMLGVLTLGC